MKLNTTSILNQLDAMGVALEDRSYLLSIAFARAMSYRLPLPTSPVGNPYEFFATNHRVVTEELLGAINERVVVDIDATLDLTSRFWVFRYRLAYDANNIAMRQFIDAVVKVGSREIPPKVSEWMIKYEASDALEEVARFLNDSLAVQEK